MPKLSAIISTYNSERFIRECLEDLLAQTLYRNGGLEIIVVASGTQQGEAKIVEDYQKQHPHIRLYTTPRETMYQAWNNGIRLAEGEFLTNANTDDRHAPDGLERLVQHLERSPSISLAYGDCYLSRVPNETFAQNQKQLRYVYPKYFAPGALLHYQFSPQPVWRRSAHDVIGEFSDTLRTAGDYDFNLRFALKLKAEKIPGDAVGLYLAHDEALSFKDKTLRNESDILMETYRAEKTVEALYVQAGAPSDTPPQRAAIHTDLGLRALEYFPPWFLGQPHREPQFALACFQRALAVDATFSPALNNLIVLLATSGNPGDALALGERSANMSGASSELRENLTLLRAALKEPNSPYARGEQSVDLKFVPSGLSFPSQAELVSLD